MEMRIFELTDRLILRGITRRAAGSYTKKFYEFGDIDLTIPLKASSAIECCPDRIICIDNKFWAIIENWRISRNDQGGVIHFTGSTMEKWLENRNILPTGLQPQDAPAGFDSVAGHSETVMKHYVRNNLVSPDNPGRAYKLLQIAPDQSRGLANDAYYGRFGSVHSALAKIGQKAQLGFEITGDMKTSRFIFDVKQGVDRSARQTVHRPVVLSIDRGSLSSFEYVHETGSSSNVFYCTRSGAQFEDEAFTQTYFLDGIEQTGHNRRERHLDISVDSDGDSYDEMESVARKDMEQYRETQSFEAEILKGINRPGKDFNVGDIVALRDAASDLDIDRQIFELQTSVSESGESYHAVFGSPALTKFELLNRKIGG